MDKKAILLLLHKLVVWVSLKRLVLLFLCVFVGIVSLTMFEQRSVILEAWNNRDASTAPRRQVIEFSGALEKQLQGAVHGSASIIGITVQAVNLKVNEKQVVFSYFDEPGLTQLFDSILKAQGPVNSMFDHDQSNNLQMVSVINGEFTCVKIEETQIFRSHSDVARSAKTLCRMSIPPFYGGFSGFVTLWLREPPSAELISQTRLEIVRLSSEVYRELVLSKRVNQN